MATETQRWRSHPALGAILDAFIFLVPIGIGAAVAVVGSHLVPRPRALALAVAWWAGDLVISAGASLVVSKQVRKLLPLSALLKLSMAFPDQTPSRLGVALRAGTTGSLKRRLSSLDLALPDNATTKQAAEHILMLASALNAHDRQTRGHGERVRALTDMLGNEM
jgi:hypothetical protein